MLRRGVVVMMVVVVRGDSRRGAVVVWWWRRWWRRSTWVMVVVCIESLQSLAEGPDVVVGEAKGLDLGEFGVVRSGGEDGAESVECVVEHVHTVTLTVVGFHSTVAADAGDVVGTLGTTSNPSGATPSSCSTASYTHNPTTDTSDASFLPPACVRLAIFVYLRHHSGSVGGRLPQPLLQVVKLVLQHLVLVVLFVFHGIVRHDLLLQGHHTHLLKQPREPLRLGGGSGIGGGGRNDVGGEWGTGGVLLGVCVCGDAAPYTQALPRGCGCGREGRGIVVIIVVVIGCCSTSVTVVGGRGGRGGNVWTTGMDLTGRGGSMGGGGGGGSMGVGVT